MQFAVTCTARPSDTVLVVEGELDISTVKVLREAVAEALTEDPAALVVDLTPTTFIDSRGCREVVASAKACAVAGIALRLVVPPQNRHVRRVVDLVQLDVLVPLLDSLPPA